MTTEDIFDHAMQYLDASRRLSQTKPFLFKPTFYCALHAVELALKGHLVNSGLSAENLRHRELGHKIDKLLERALEKNAIGEEMVDFMAQQAIKLGSRDYDGKCFEYPETMYSTYPIGVWHDIAEDLMEGLRSKLQ